MITLIGVVAGEIWNHLEAHDRRDSISNMVEAMGKDRDMLLMSIGWLAREGHMVLHGEGPDYMVELKN